MCIWCCKPSNTWTPSWKPVSHSAYNMWMIPHIHIQNDGIYNSDIQCEYCIWIEHIYNGIFHIFIFTNVSNHKTLWYSTSEETPETPAILPPMAQASSHTNAPHFKSLFTLMPDASLSVAQQDEDFQFAVIIVIRDPKSRISSFRKKNHLLFEPIENIARCFRTEDEALEYSIQLQVRLEDLGFIFSPI